MMGFIDFVWEKCASADTGIVFRAVKDGMSVNNPSSPQMAEALDLVFRLPVSSETIIFHYFTNPALANFDQSQAFLPIISMCWAEFCHKRSDLRLERRLPSPLTEDHHFLNCKCAIEGKAKYNDVRYMHASTENECACGCCSFQRAINKFCRIAALHSFRCYSPCWEG